MATTTLSYHLYTLFLFTKSDLKTLVLPVVSNVCVPAPFSRFSKWSHAPALPRQTLFALAASPSCSLSRLPHALLWFWVHALQFGLANQSHPHAIAEDTINHPYRPLPTGRISVQTARALRWTVVPLCLLLSAAYGPRTTLASLLGSLYMLAYNEGGGARGHWLVRNVQNAVGYSVAEAGTMLVACTSLSRIS
jgi:4-hydroxybenzoate polyprenyltransferase